MIWQYEIYFSLVLFSRFRKSEENLIYSQNNCFFANYILPNAHCYFISM